jgi:hypothetical protein
MKSEIKSLKQIAKEVPVMEIEGLGPKTTEKILEEIQNKEESLESVKIIPLEELEVEETGKIDKKDSKIIHFVPMDLDLIMSAPIDTIREKNLTYMVTREIGLDLWQKSKPGKPHPQLLGYLKEMSTQLDSLHRMTEPIQDEVRLTKLRIVAAMMESDGDVSEQFKIMFLKEMQRKREAREAKEAAET